MGENAVNIPVWDDWERGKLLKHSVDGTLDLDYLASAHIDHRMLFPRLAVLALNKMSGGDLRAEIWAIFTVLLMTGGCLFFVLAKTLPDWRWLAACGFLVNLVLFSPVQYQNLLWAVQLAFMLPLVFLAALVAVMSSGLSARVKFVLALLCCVAGCLSYGHGLVLWPVAILLGLLLRKTGDLRTRLTFATGMTIACVAVVIPYMTWNYVNTSEASHASGQAPGEAPPGLVNLANVLTDAEDRERFVDCFKVALGNQWARISLSDPWSAAVRFGTWTFVGFLGMAALVLFYWKRPKEWDALLPWVALASYSFSASALLALGRSTIGWERVILPRYISTSMFIAIAFIVVVAWLCHRRQWSAYAVAGGMFFVGLQVAIWDHGLHKMEAWKQARLMERFAVTYINHHEPEFGTRLDNRVEFAKQQARFLDGQGWLNPPLAKALDWGPFAPTGKELPAGRADILRADLVGSDQLAIVGYAEFGGDGNRPADGVLLTWRTSGDEEWKVFGVVEMAAFVLPRAAFIDGEFGSPKPSLSKVKNTAKWARYIPLDALPANGEVEIKAWAADAEKMKAHGIARVLRLDRSSTAPGRLSPETPATLAQNKSGKLRERVARAE
ncbi:MAG: hypothetical protein ACR2RV_24205 [Verrucomicrobiales bacterium]